MNSHSSANDAMAGQRRQAGARPARRGHSNMSSHAPPAARRERLNVELTQHAGDEMHHPALGAFGPEWSEAQQ
jgi:hypothetical protein